MDYNYINIKSLRGVCAKHITRELDAIKKGNKPSIDPRAVLTATFGNTTYNIECYLLPNHDGSVVYFQALQSGNFLQVVDGVVAVVGEDEVMEDQPTVGYYCGLKDTSSNEIIKQQFARIADLERRLASLSSDTQEAISMLEGGE